jgi:hypothetical protein
MSGARSVVSAGTGALLILIGIAPLRAIDEHPNTPARMEVV